MSNAPQNQNQSQNKKTLNVPTSNPANTDKVGNNIKKDEPTAAKPAMKEGESCSTSGNKLDKPTSKIA